MSELCCKKCQSLNYTKNGNTRGLQRGRGPVAKEKNIDTLIGTSDNFTSESIAA